MMFNVIMLFMFDVSFKVNKIMLAWVSPRTASEIHGHWSARGRILGRYLYVDT